jgi:ribonuclease HII
VHHRRTFSPVAAALARTGGVLNVVLPAESEQPAMMIGAVEAVRLDDLRAAP